MNTKERQMDGKKFCFISCVNDEVLYAECERHIDALHTPDGYKIEKVKITGAKGMAEAYQKAMQQSDARYKVYLHQDTFILNKNLLHDVLQLFTRHPRIGMIGVVGATRLPSSGVWFNSALHSFGEARENRRGGGLNYLLGKWNKQTDRLMRFRRVRGEYLPVVVIDGLIMITQYNIPWRTDLYGGFIYYEGPQCIEFIKQGYEVVVPRQKPTWCMHYGNRTERAKDEEERYRAQFRANMEIFRREYAEFLRKPARTLLEKYRR
ncbi:MAG: glycosyltransferase family protein [Firmicutes bacterium]|nr:glycosyltransferase family protein [Bacillota bacterium]